MQGQGQVQHMAFVNYLGVFLRFLSLDAKSQQVFIYHPVFSYARIWYTVSPLIFTAIQRVLICHGGKGSESRLL